jgi:hypothetical protein
VVGGSLDEAARLVPRLVHRLPESRRPIHRRRPVGEDEAAADGSFALEEVDEVVEPVDEQGFDAVRLTGEFVALALLDRIEVADEIEEGEPGCSEQLGTVVPSDDEADVGLVLEGLPAQVSSAVVDEDRGAERPA